LEHFAMYGIGLPAVITQLFFDGRQCGHVLKKLAEEGGPLAAFPRALPGGLTYYRLSHRGTALVNAPKERSQPLGSAALDLAIGLAYFCCLAGPARRHRAERKDLLPFFGDNNTPPANTAHILSDELGHPAIFRVYQATGSFGHTVQRVGEHLSQARGFPAIRPWLEAGDFGVCVLVPAAQKVQPCRSALERSGLTRSAAILCGVGPTAETLASELRQRKERT
jgi:hypothetical protein